MRVSKSRNLMSTDDSFKKSAPSKSVRLTNQVNEPAHEPNEPVHEPKPNEPAHEPMSPS